MVEKFRESFDLVKFENEINRISFRYGIIKQGDVTVYESTSPITTNYLSRTIRDTLILLNKYDSENNVVNMTFSNKSASSLQLLEFEEPMTAPVNGDKIRAQFSELPHSSGDKIFIILTHINENTGVESNYNFVYFKQHVNILQNKRLQIINDNPIELTLSNSLIISPSHLVSVHDITNELLVVKNVSKAEVHHNLGEYFELKAREILAETIKNNDLKLNKTKVNTVLKNKSYFSREFINSHLDVLRETLARMELTILELEEGIMTEPSIVFNNSSELNTYIDLMSQYITRHILERPEEERTNRNA